MLIILLIRKEIKIMSKSKKITTAVLAVIASVFAAVALFMLPGRTTLAAEQELTDGSFFTIVNNEFRGLSNAGISAANGAESNTIVLPASVTSIADGTSTGNSLFGTASSKITAIKLASGSNLRTIGKYAFANLENLGSINLDAATQLEDLGEGVFSGCTSLTDLYVVAGGVTALPDHFADGCTALVNTTMTDSITEVGDFAFNGCTSLRSFPFGSSSNLKIIGDRAFYSCRQFTEINLPGKVQTIGNSAFFNCNSATEVTIPHSVTYINTQAFNYCYGLKTINYYAEKATVLPNPFALSASQYAQSKVTVNIGSADYKVKRLPAALFCSDDTTTGTGVIEGHRGIKTVNIENVVLKDGVGDEGWGLNLFKNCTSLTEVNFIGDKCDISGINISAFEGCTSLKTISGMENIGLKTIHPNAFKGCSALFHVVIGAEVTEIGNKAFDGCERLIEVVDMTTGQDALNITAKSTENGQVAENAYIVFKSSTDTTKIDRTNNNGFVFFSDADTYLIDYTGNGGNITLPDKYNGTVTYKIFKKAFYKNTVVTGITIRNESGITVIGDSAFAECTALQSVSFPSTLAELGATAFQGCTALTDVAFNSVQFTTIQSATFKGCTNLTNIDLSGIQNVNYQAFMNCSLLTNVNFGDSLKVIGGQAFSGCNSLEVVTLPDSLEQVWDNAFENCGLLNTVELPSDGNGEKTVSYGEGAFGSPSSNVILISSDKEQYKKDIAKPNLSVYTDNLTYKVDVYLYYDDGSIGAGGVQDGEHKTERLFGMSGGYALKGNKWINTGIMPQQNGYVTSVWYDSADRTNRVSLDDFTEMLAKEEPIKLYAYYFKKPDLTVRNDAVYFDGMSLDAQGVLKNCFYLNGNEITDENVNLGSAFQYNIHSHYFVNGVKDSDWSYDPSPAAGSSYKVSMAGKYTLEIYLFSAAYGTWSSPFEMEFEIQPKDIELENEIEWVPSIGSLAPGFGEKAKTLYFYGTNTPQTDEDTNRTPSKTVNVINSYVVSTGREVTLSLQFKTNKYGKVDNGSYTGDLMATAAGTYTAYVTVIPDNNYRFTFEYGESARLQGLTFRQVGYNVQISKTWYIANSKTNYLVTSDGGGMYGIQSKDGIAWTYGDESKNIPVAPTLSYTPDDAEELISFTLIYNNGNGEFTIADRVNLGDALKEENGFAYYFNSSMPAGRYSLTFYIGDKLDGGDVAYAGDPEGETYEFVVGAQKLTAAQINNVTDKLASVSDKKDIEYVAGEVAFNHAKYKAVLDDIRILKFVEQVSRRGIWAKTEKYNNFYFDDFYLNSNKDTAFEIAYSVKEGGLGNYVNDANPSKYYLTSEYKNGTALGIIPKTIGSYTVFYKVYAPNYSANGEDAIYGRFELNISYYIDTADWFDNDEYFRTDDESALLFTYDLSEGSVIDKVVARLEDKMFASYEIYTLREEDKKIGRAHV